MARLCWHTCICKDVQSGILSLVFSPTKSQCLEKCNTGAPDIPRRTVHAFELAGMCCNGWRSAISGTRGSQTTVGFHSDPKCLSQCECIGFGDTWGPSDDNRSLTKRSCASHMSKFWDVYTTERRNLTNRRTWHEYQDETTTIRGTGNFGCPRVGACCIDRVGTPDLRQCRLFTARGCAAGVYQNHVRTFRSGGVFMGTSVECKCASYTNDPFQIGPNFPDSIYSKCVGIGNEFEVGNANDACANTGACCFDDCCTRATRELCRSLGGRSHINAGCTTACPEANCREALFELAVEDGIKPDNDFRELGLAGYMVPQSNAKIPLGIKTAVDGRFGDEFEGVDPYPDTNFFETICGYWTGNTILDDNNYVVLEACNNQRLTSGDQRSTELDAVQDDNGYAHFGGGFTKPEQSRCHGIGPIT